MKTKDSVKDRDWSDIKRLTQDLHTVSGAHVGIMDFDGNRRAESTEGPYNFCQYCRQACPDFENECHCSDKRNLDVAKRSKKNHVYRCHAGLTEAIIPVIYKDKSVGVIFLGQIITENDRASDFQAIYTRLAERYPEHFNEDAKKDMRKAYDNTAVLTKEKLAAIMDLASVAMQSINISRWFYAGANSSEERLRRLFATQDFTRISLEDISASKAAEELNMSYSQLNRLSIQLTGLPYKQYVLKLKIDAAADIFRRNPQKSVSELATIMGFDDPYYFSRLFRKKTGLSCQEFKRLSQSKEK